ncbi:4-alpha-glucanotransferase [Candidatus Pseudoscillospira sp. SGI.172]|uniref:4-alpha-glucanotransferase n=1 Tax=Candidatus Pseudoscillospira sp. SGI.172 TaxID=3420582 RepID=UPI002A7AD104|nr:4-alpha-glucanotransferase [Pseudoflavonifractor sp.]MDY3020268.1 4-alpha-glucanotransferase [Oscillospiraceae bacterium]
MRNSGVLMHLTSLPSPWGIGTMGQAARDFADFLASAGQTYWQILPIGPTSYGDSPYQSFSTFAGNPYLIDLDDLAAEGLLERAEYEGLDWGSDPGAVDYGLLYERRYPVLKRAVARLLAAPPADYAPFLAENALWLDDYALFMALKDAHGGRAWSGWAEPLRRRESAALEEARRTLGGDVAFWKGVQYLFFRQWNALKAYANERGVFFIGDLPIYVAGDSADVWARPEQFQLDADLRPVEVAGCPPDGFSADGQLWGNPLFDWGRMEADGFSWWIERIRRQRSFYDVLRIDHFRGFDSYYAIPYGEATARNGQWRQGPGMRLFRAVEAALGRQDIIAEDLGFLTDSVRQLLRESGFPGMKVLQFAFDSREESDYLPHNYGKHCVVYVGTHDNDTALGWLNTAAPEDRDFAVEYLKLTEAEGYAWGLMRGAWASVADLAVVTAQDLLELGGEARMNSPSTLGINWKWRALPGVFTQELARRLRRETGIYRRLPRR